MTPFLKFYLVFALISKFQSLKYFVVIRLSKYLFCLFKIRITKKYEDLGNWQNVITVKKIQIKSTFITNFHVQIITISARLNVWAVHLLRIQPTKEFIRPITTYIESTVHVIIVHLLILLYNCFSFVCGNWYLLNTSLPITINGSLVDCLIDWLVFDANFNSSSVIRWLEQLC